MQWAADNNKPATLMCSFGRIEFPAQVCSEALTKKGALAEVHLERYAIRAVRQRDRQYNAAAQILGAL